jgi:hypothetical protein
MREIEKEEDKRDPERNGEERTGGSQWEPLSSRGGHFSTTDSYRPWKVSAAGDLELGGSFGCGMEKEAEGLLTSLSFSFFPTTTLNTHQEQTEGDPCSKGRGQKAS